MRNASPAHTYPSTNSHPPPHTYTFTHSHSNTHTHHTHTDEERITQVKRRALLRLLGDLYLVGLLTDAKPLLRILQDIASSLTWERDKSAAANNVALLAHFCKVRCGVEVG